MTTSEPRWTQTESDTYRKLAEIAVPHRDEQIATLLTLFPFSKGDHFRVVELSPGEGRLARAVLEAYLNVELLALEFEPSMQEETKRRIEPFSGRGQVAYYDMMQTDWFDYLNGADVVVSSLAIHHLGAAQKQALYTAVFERLSERGAFFVADLVMPQNPTVRGLFAQSWDESAKTASIESTGDEALYIEFEREHWNYYRYPDDFDKPSPLFHHLLWLQAAGFPIVDCFWMQAGHAIYGGYKSVTKEE